MIGMPQKEIADILRTSEVSVSRWAKDGKWKAKRDQEDSFKETAAEQVRSLISHQLTVLALIAEKQTIGLDSKLSVKELQDRLISKGDVDGLSKLYSSIKGKEMEWDVLVRCIREFIDYLESTEIKLAKEVFPHANEFLNERRKRV